MSVSRSIHDINLKPSQLSHVLVRMQTYQHAISTDVEHRKKNKNDKE
jgi:hypothetical protein